MYVSLTHQNSNPWMNLLSLSPPSVHSINDIHLCVFKIITSSHWYCYLLNLEHVLFGSIFACPVDLYFSKLYLLLTSLSLSSSTPYLCFTLSSYASSSSSRVYTSLDRKSVCKDHFRPQVPSLVNKTWLNDSDKRITMLH